MTWNLTWHNWSHWWSIDTPVVIQSCNVIDQIQTKVFACIKSSTVTELKFIYRYKHN